MFVHFFLHYDSLGHQHWHHLGRSRGCRALCLHVTVMLATAGGFFLSSLMGFAEEPTRSFTLTTVVIKGAGGTQEVSGRIVVEAQDGGVLLEERNGRIRQLTPAMIVSKASTSIPFSVMTDVELGDDLLSQVSTGFEIHQTDHYVICSNSAEEYSEVVGKLLEKVFDQYFEFMNEQEIVVRPSGWKAAGHHPAVRSGVQRVRGRTTS
jgi:hypothetical protein